MVTISIRVAPAIPFSHAYVKRFIIDAVDVNEFVFPGKNRTTLAEIIKLDIFYTKNMSLWLDLPGGWRSVLDLTHLNGGMSEQASIRIPYIQFNRGLA
jgi:hypothetical protein